MPLSMLNIGNMGKIIRITGKDDLKLFLERLGFLEDVEVTVVSKIGMNLIVNIKDSKIAISKEMANRIFVN